MAQSTKPYQQPYRSTDAGCTGSGVANVCSKSKRSLLPEGRRQLDVRVHGRVSSDPVVCAALAQTLAEPCKAPVKRGWWPVPAGTGHHPALTGALPRAEEPVRRPAPRCSLHARYDGPLPAAPRTSSHRRADPAADAEIEPGDAKLADAELVDYLSGSVSLGILVAFIALFALLFGALLVLSQLDHAWILVGRAAGHDQRTGAMVRIFGCTAVVCGIAFTFWFLVIHGPGSSIIPGRGETPAAP